MNEGIEIPKGWAATTLGEIISISSGKGLVQSNQVSDGEYYVYGGNGIIGKHNNYLFEDNQLIIGRVGVNCGNAHLTKLKSWITDNAFVVSFNAKEIDIKYLYWLIKVLNLNTYSSSTAQPVISQGKLYPIEIKIAPLPEQHRIVAKIEELFSSLDKGIESLKTAQEQLKVYRQAVLKWAFEGKLTNKDVKEGELPEGWRMVDITKLASKEKNALKAGPFGSSLKKEFYAEKGYKIYGQEQVIKDDPYYGDYFIDEDKYKELSSCSVKPFDVLISLVGTVGKVLVLPKDAAPGIINPRLIKISLDLDKYLPRFFKYYFESASVKSMYSSKAQGTTMDVLNLGILKTIPFPSVPIEEQHLIVSEIESRLSVCDKIEESISTALQQAEALRQSILKKAFEGKLVPQDPNDEPAGVLLERIRAERELLRQNQGKYKTVKPTKKS